jgi:TRAP-type mannitol/chloroaromatic compound transport system permease large subunit
MKEVKPIHVVILVILILLSDILQLSVGTMFAAAVVPGMVLAAIYCVYIVIIGMVKPEWVPPIPVEERDAVSRRQLWARFFKVVVPPVLLVMAVLDGRRELRSLLLERLVRS